VVLGGRFSSFLDLRNHQFGPGKRHVNAEQMTGLGVYVLTETAFREGSKNILRCEINVPVISYALLTDHYNANVSSSTEDIDYDRSVIWQLLTSGRVVSFNALFEVQASLSYNVFLSDRIGIDLQYQCQYSSYEQFPDLFHAHVLTNRFLVGLLVTL
jgi:hypothetical protein